MKQELEKCFPFHKKTSSLLPQTKKVSLFFQKTEAPDIFDVARYSLLKPDYDIGRIPTTQREIDLRVSKDKIFSL